MVDYQWTNVEQAGKIPTIVPFPGNRSTGAGRGWVWQRKASLA